MDDYGKTMYQSIVLPYMSEGSKISISGKQPIEILVKEASLDLYLKTIDNYGKTMDSYGKTIDNYGILCRY